MTDKALAGPSLPVLSSVDIVKGLGAAPRALLAALVALYDDGSLQARLRTIWDKWRPGQADDPASADAAPEAAWRRETRCCIPTCRCSPCCSPESRVAGTVRVESGRLRIYSPVDMDFWQMATLFVDRPLRNEPTPAELTLKGWKVIDVAPGEALRFTAALVGVGGDDALLLEALEGEATGIAFELLPP